MESNQITYTSVPEGLYSLTAQQESFMLAFEKVIKFSGFFPKHFSLLSVRQSVELVLTGRDEAVKRIKELFGLDPETEKSLTIRRRLYSTEADRMLGYYAPSSSLMAQPKPKVVLIIDRIEEFAASTQRDAEKILLYVYLHEMMHAFYHTAGGPTVREVEEAMAEAGALRFLSIFWRHIPRVDWEADAYAYDLLTLAEICVKEKLTHQSVVCYGIGYLIQLASPEDLTPAMYCAVRSGILTEGCLLEEYRDSLKDYCQKPLPTGEERCLKALRRLFEMARILVGSSVRMPFIEKLTDLPIINHAYPPQTWTKYPVPVVVIPIDKYVKPGERALPQAICAALDGCAASSDCMDRIQKIRSLIEDYPFRGALVLYGLLSRVVAYGYFGEYNYRYTTKVFFSTDDWELDDKELLNVYVKVMGQKVTLPVSLKNEPFVFLNIRR